MFNKWSVSKCFIIAITIIPSFTPSQLASAADPSIDPSVDPPEPADPSVPASPPVSIAGIIIAPGNKYVSGCNQYKKDLPGYFTEAYLMAKAGLDKTNALLNKDPETTYSDAYLFTLLWGPDMVSFREGKDFDDDNYSNKLIFPVMRKALGNIQESFMKDLGVKVYCGSRALVWTEYVYDKVTGKPTDTLLVPYGSMERTMCAPEGYSS